MAEFKTSNLRIPPQNIDSEKAFLGSIMLRPDALYEVVDTIDPDDFYAEKHRIIYQTILALMGKSEPIDLLSVSSKLKERKQLEQIGGNSYLTELANSVPSSSNIAYYAGIVHKKSIMRKLIEAADHISELGFNETIELESVLDEAEKKIFGVTNFQKTHKFVHLRDTLTEAWERIDRLHKSTDELRGVPSGFRDLDGKLAGFQKSDLIILAARPSMGKTALALDIARQAATLHNIPVGIFSLEMSSQQLVDRMLAAESRVDAWKLRVGKLSVDEEFSKLRDALDKLSKAPIYIDDQPGNNIVKMRSVARRLKSEHSLGLIIVDYLQLMAPTKNYDSMVNQVTEISRSLKNLARELDVPVIALSQLSRAVEARGGRPRLSDLRDSGSIEQDADVVMFIHREDKYNESSEKPNIAEIMIEKHRNGPTGKVELYFDDKKATFLSVEKGDFEEFGKGDF
ncbi:MAG: replicative DNA helicase [Candidatus Paceibacterota bacterium]|jgi:replicative DNA helicase